MVWASRFPVPLLRRTPRALRTECPTALFFIFIPSFISRSITIPQYGQSMGIDVPLIGRRFISRQIKDYSVRLLDNLAKKLLLSLSSDRLFNLINFTKLNI